jgi:hypothetical protein
MTACLAVSRVVEANEAKKAKETMEAEDANQRNPSRGSQATLLNKELSLRRRAKPSLGVG